MFDVLENNKSFSEIVEYIISYSYTEYLLFLQSFHDAKHKNLLENYKQKYYENDPPDAIDSSY